MWMKATAIAQALDVPLGRAYVIARRERWEIRFTWPHTKHVYEWDTNITPALLERERARSEEVRRQHYPATYGHPCRHGRTSTYTPCQHCITRSRALVDTVHEEQITELPAGLPVWIFR